MTVLLALLAFAAVQASPPPSTGVRDAPHRSPAAEEVVGVWADIEGDCSSVTRLQQDGVFVAPNGGRGSWEVRGGRLILTGPGGSFSWTILLENRDTIRLVEDNGAVSRSFRCPSAAVPSGNNKI